MKAGRILYAAVAPLALACALTLGARAQDGKSATHISSKTGEWHDGPAPGVKMISLRGDMAKGAHATFTKFDAGADHGWHTHTADVTLVVISGAYLYKAEDGKEIRVGAGDYIFIPGGTKHWSGGDKKEGCLFFQESPAAFDLIKAEAPGGKK
jgi:quercetin dioxygenase-like cupin family protein